MTEEERVKQTMEFMKKLNSRPMTPETKAYIEYMDWVDSVEYNNLPETIKRRKELADSLTI